MRFALVPLITSLALACRTTPALSGDAALVSPPATSAIDYRALVGAADRSDDDRALDPQRKPVEFLEFLQVRPGMRVAELIAGFGYTTELLARAVGEGGVVYAQNNRFVLERFAEAGWAARLATPAMKPVVRVDRELDDPLPLEARDLDLVVIMLF
jgi:predicted methyltransferase